MNRDVIRRVGEGMAEGRWADVLAHVSPDVVGHVPAVGDVVGVDGLVAFLLETADKTDDGERFELLDSLVGEQFAALYFRITAERQGREPLDNLTVHLARFDGDQIAEIWFHNFDGPAVAAFWA